ncbi:MAG: radical SAM protein [Candidatus Omnitrophica bacterium]|nr:radical SAM protein [Candidatus Omnitrophota bacterium]
MKKQNLSGFSGRIVNICRKRKQFPIRGQLELTYRCNLNCLHCYCSGLEYQDKELTTAEWKKIIDRMAKEGCLELCFTGGEPLIRKDFLEIYAYAKTKGFLITIFSNGVLLTKEIISYLEKSPPFSIEITLNGITRKTYERITRVKDTFDKVIENINQLAKSGINLFLKANCLKENKNEIAGIKAFTHKLLGEDIKRFKYDPFIFAKLNGDRSPCKHRLSAQELLEVRRSDPKIWKEFSKSVCSITPGLVKNKERLYRCTSWMTNFFINPSGWIRPCNLSTEYSADLKTATFKEGFYNIFGRLQNEEFKSDSKCKNCLLRRYCYHCPSRAYLETKSKESPVDYYCQLAKTAFNEKNRLFLKKGGNYAKEIKV